MTSEKTNSNSKTVLVVGATGNTGFPLVKQLLARGYNLRIIVRSLDKFPQELLENSKLKIIKASLLDLSDEQMLEAVKGCVAVASCLGHTMSFKGIFGKPRTLVLEAVKRLCVAITANRSADKTKFLLMNTVVIAILARELLWAKGLFYLCYVTSYHHIMIMKPPLLF